MEHNNDVRIVTNTYSISNLETETLVMEIATGSFYLLSVYCISSS